MKIQSTKNGVATTLAGLLALAFVVCGSRGCGGSSTEELAAIKICGVPATAAYTDLDPFKSCAFMKLCFKKKGQTKLKDCQLVDFFDASGFVDSLPFDEDLSLVAECYDSDPNSPSPEPNNLMAKGQTVPFRHRDGDVLDKHTLYLMIPSSFGPTMSFGTSTTPDPMTGFPPVCGGIESKPFSARWGATSTELFNSMILIAGGVDGTDSDCTDWSDPTCVTKAHSTAEIYDPRGGTFSLVGYDGSALMTQKRAFAAAVRLPSEEVVIFGGVNAAGEPTSTVDIYDPVGQSFMPGQPMLDTRSRFTATLISSAEAGYILLIGGYGTGEGSWEVWTPTLGTIANGQLAESRWNHTSNLITTKEDPAVKRNMVVIAGGEGGGEPGASSVRDTLEIFDIDANQLDPLPIALCSNTPGAGTKKTMHASAFVPKRHFLYIAGGFKDTKHAEPVQDICVWHSSQEKWSGEAGTFRLKTGRGALTATALPNNVVLFAGGLIKDSGTLKCVETVEIVFEYVKQDTGETVVDIGPGAGFAIPMLHPRWDHGAIVGADGKVLFYGGIACSPSSFSPIQETELFNPQ